VGLSGRAVHVEVALGPFGIRTVLLPVPGLHVDRENRAISLRGKDHARPGNDGQGRQGDRIAAT
jgi:hypothetical protein